LTSKTYNDKGQTPLRRIIAERFGCSTQCAWLWLKSDKPEIQRRVAACLNAKRTDYTHPEGGLVPWLHEQYGVTMLQVATWYGYHSRSFTEYQGNGRYKDRYPKRAWTMIDYYLKEHGYVSE